METFIGQCIKEMIDHGVSVEFTKRKITGKFGYNFFYDGMHPRYGKRTLLKINFYTNSLADNYGIFVHEYSHFCQWRDKIPLWDVARIANNNFDEWLRGEKEYFSEEDLRYIQELELDCDKRALELIKVNNLPIDVNQYIKESNGYILSYNLIYQNREFYVSSAYSDEEALKYIPDHHITKEELGLRIPEFENIFMSLVND